MKIKTRNFLISFLMLLTLVFGVFAFMPKTTMTASAAGGSEPAVASISNIEWNGNTAKWDSVQGASTYSVILYKDGTALGETRTANTSYDFSNMMNIKGNGKYTFTVASDKDSYATKSNQSAQNNYTSSQVANDESTLLDRLEIGGVSYGANYANPIKKQMSGTGWTYSEVGNSFDITLTHEYTGEPISASNANAYINTSATEYVDRVIGEIIIDGWVTITAKNRPAIDLSMIGCLRVSAKTDFHDKLIIKQDGGDSVIRSTYPIPSASWPKLVKSILEFYEGTIAINANSLSKSVIENGLRKESISIIRTALNIITTNSDNDDIVGFVFSSAEDQISSSFIDIDMDKGTPLYTADEELAKALAAVSKGWLKPSLLGSLSDYSFQYSDSRTDLVMSERSTSAQQSTIEIRGVGYTGGTHWSDSWWLDQSNSENPVLILTDYNGGPIRMYDIEGADVMWKIKIVGDCKINGNGEYAIEMKVNEFDLRYTIARNTLNIEITDGASLTIEGELGINNYCYEPIVSIHGSGENGTPGPVNIITTGCALDSLGYTVNYGDRNGMDSYGEFNCFDNVRLYAEGTFQFGSYINGDRYESNRFAYVHIYRGADVTFVNKDSSSLAFAKYTMYVKEGYICTRKPGYIHNYPHNVEITEATVNGHRTTSEQTVKVSNLNNSAAVKFSWNGLSQDAIDDGCFLVPSIKCYIDGKQIPIGYTPVNNSVTFNPGITYDGQNITFVLDLVLRKPGTRETVDSHTVNIEVENESVPNVDVTVDVPVAGQTPVGFVGTENTDGISIVSGTWYEYNGGSLKKVQDGDKFVAGNQYVYCVTFALDKGYNFGEGFKTTINGTNAKKNGDYFNWTSAVMTAKAELVANAVKSIVTVDNGDTVTLKVNATGDGLITYVWQGDETVGAPSVGVNFRDNITLECVNAGTYTYKCIVKDANGTKTVEFTVIVLPKETSNTVPAQPAFKGTGFMGIEDSNNITVEKDGSITLIPNYVFNMNSNDITKTPVVGEVSFTWEIYAYDEDGKYVGKLGNVTTENLVIDADSEYINTKNVAQYGIILTITNTADGQQNSMFTGATVYVVEPEATGNLGGQIGSEQEQAIPYAMRKMSARSANNFEGTVVYLMKDSEVAYMTEANAEGYYMFTNIPYGSYSVKVEKEGYENYNKPVEVNQAEVEHDITIIVHVCFADEGNEMYFPAKQPNCEMGELGNIECRGCISCGKYYDMEGNLLADSAADPYSLNDMGIPYAALLYPVHDYCGEAQEGGNADQYLRHRAETCLEETTYWYYCINGNCKKSAGDDPSAVDKYYVASDSNQTHSYTVQSTDGDYFKEDTGVDCQDNKWYYYACEYCGMRDSSSIWMSEEKGPHIPHEDDGDCLTAVTCTKCDTVTTEAKAAHVDENEDGKCDACGKDMPTLPDDGGDNSGDSSEPDSSEPDSSEPDSSEPDSSTPDSSVNSGSSDSGKKSGCGSAIGGIGVGMFALASAATFVFFKKRKEN